MSNKLYTEEQIRKAYNKGIDSGFWGNSSEEQEDVIVNSLTPIELPTDKEIEEEASIVAKKCSATIYEESAYVIGAKWMKSKIQGGNK